MFALEHELDAWMQQTQTQTQLSHPVRTNGHADGALIARIQELENEVRELREQIAALTGASRNTDREAQAA